ncbi:hypothetical protein IAQ61_007665 [Plenodomus lingam]|uniref:uncharacterized protein n=1 Tax=Leptosphaeria maculans TaxID=5022 RepID=UPI00332B1030|nr:hypothetical protein IAQ61_007665 [Plenodomus lingam]
MVITRSTFVGAGSYVGHWLGDNVGADVCGFLDNTNEHLCARWTVLGAFYPFYRNHNVNGAISQEAYRWESVAAAARKAIDIRYRLLDYIYTAMHKQTVDGTPMLAPMWQVLPVQALFKQGTPSDSNTRMHFPTDPKAAAIQLQFFYGPSLLINPVTEERSTSVEFYVPNATWYDFELQKPLPAGAAGSMVLRNDVADTDIPILIRGGSIIPLRVKSAMTTHALRDQDFELLVAPDKDGKAWGTLYLDDGESLVQDGVSEISFSWDGSTIRMEGSFGFKTSVGVKSVVVMGNEGILKHVLNAGLDGLWEYDIDGGKRR